MRSRSKTRPTHPRPPAGVSHAALATGSRETRSAAPAPARPRRAWLRQVVLPALVLVALTVAAFAPVVRAGYVWDDDLYVTGNPHLRTAAGLSDIWFRLGTTTMYAPVVFTTLWVE